MKKNLFQNIDVLVIGSGGSGLTAALEAKKSNVNVLVVSKTYPTHSQTCQAQGGINASREESQEDIQSHINDTLKGSHGLGSLEATKIMCQNAPKTIKWLDTIGVPFSRDKENKIAQRKFGAASKIRTCYSSDYTGLKILHSLYDNCIKEEIDFLNEYQLLDLIKENNKIIGADFLCIKSSEVISIFAKTTILATGGYSNIYNKFTTNSHATTGDGVAAALRAGAKLSNMEMIQFHPTAMKGNNILISESARGEGGYLVNKDEKRFIDELKPRDEVARAIYSKQIKNEEVFLDLRHIGEEKIDAVMPQERRLAKEFMNIDITKELLPINPAAHYCMGGIKTNVSCETSLENLYACGECSQVGIHGANRLGGNSLQEIITFGKIAGVNAANKSKSIQNSQSILTKTHKSVKNYFTQDSTINFYEIKEDMGRAFFNNLGLFRNEEKIDSLIIQVNKWKKDLKNMGIRDKSQFYNKNLVEFIEFKNMLELGEAVLLGAKMRKESRGAHFRTDFPVEKESLCKNSTIYKNSDETLSILFEDIT